MGNVVLRLFLKSLSKTLSVAKQSAQLQVVKVTQIMRRWEVDSDHNHSKDWLGDLTKRCTVKGLIAVPISVLRWRRRVDLLLETWVSSLSDKTMSYAICCFPKLDREWFFTTAFTVCDIEGTRPDSHSNYMNRIPRHIFYITERR